MTRRNFLFTILGIGAIAKAVKPNKWTFFKFDKNRDGIAELCGITKPLTHTKNFMITRNGHTIEYWNDGERIHRDDAPFVYDKTGQKIILNGF